MKRSLASALLAASSALALVPHAALAQSERNENVQIGIQDIIVTATKVQTTLQKTPISISVQAGDELRKLNLRRIDDALQSEPSIAVQQTQVGPQFYVRGIGQTTGIPSPTNQQPVALYIDGIYQPRNETVRGGMLDIERIEVLRGPQGTILGGAAFAGAVSLITADPVFDNLARVTAGGGNLDETTFEAVGNVKIADTVAIRLAGSSNVRKGYYSSGLEDSNTKIARAKLRWQPDDRFNAVLNAEYIKIGGIGPGQGSLSDTKDSDGNETGLLHYFRVRADPWDDGTPFGTSGGSPLGYRRTNLKNLSLSANYMFDGLGVLTVLPSIQKADYRSQEAQRGPQRNGESRSQQTESIEVRLTSEPSQPIRWLVGAWYYHTNYTGWFIQETIDRTIPGGPPVSCPNDTIDCVSFNFSGGDELTTKSVFGNVTVPLMNERLRVLAGLRYSVDDTVLNETAPTGNDTVPTGTSPDEYLRLVNPTFVVATDRTSKVTFVAGAEFDVTDRAMAYIRYGQGYKKGNVQLSFTGSLQRQEPSILTDRAIGFKSRWLDNKLQVNFEYFNNYYDNYAITVCSPTPGLSDVGIDGCAFPFSIFPGFNVSVATNYPKVISRGFDLSVDFKPFPNDTIRLNLGRLTSKFSGGGSLSQAQLDSATSDSARQQDLQGVYQSYSGATLQNSPKWALNASYEHVFRLGELGDLAVRGEWVHKTSLYSNLQGGSVPNDPNSVQPAYSLWNASASFTTPDSNYSLTFYVRNIGNYPVMTNYSPGAADLGPPRQYGLTLTGRF